VRRESEQIAFVVVQNVNDWWRFRLDCNRGDCWFQYFLRFAPPRCPIRVREIGEPRAGVLTFCSYRHQLQFSVEIDEANW